MALFGSLLVAEEMPNATDTPKRLVILGDSITAGYGLSPDQAYPALLQTKFHEAKLPVIVSNAGVSGDTTAGGLRRITWALSKGTDILIIALGGNDGLRGVDPVETQKNLAGIIEKARKKNPKIQVFLAGMEMPDNFGRSYTQAFKAVFPAVAKKQDATLIPFLLKDVGGVKDLNLPDRIHPNIEGQKLVARNVWEVIYPALKK